MAYTMDPGVEIKYPCPHCMTGYKSEKTMLAHAEKCPKNPVLYATAQQAEDEKIKASAEITAEAERVKKELEAKQKEEAIKLAAERRAHGIGRVEAAGRFVMVVIPGAWDVPKALAYMEDNGFRVEVYPAVGQSQMLFALFTKMK